LSSTGFDLDQVENSNNRYQLVTKLIVTLEVRSMNGLQERAELLTQQSA
jgi:uncharacterized lipoprotein YajG